MKIGVTEQTHYRWKKKYGGLRMDQSEATQGAREGELSAEAAAGRRGVGQGNPSGSRRGLPKACAAQILSPAKRREAVDTLLEAKVLIGRWGQASNTLRPYRAGLSERESLA